MMGLALLDPSYAFSSTHFLPPFPYCRIPPLIDFKHSHDRLELAMTGAAQIPGEHDRHAGSTRMQTIKTSRVLSLRKSIFLASGVGCLFGALLLLLRPAFAQPFNSYEEIRRKSQILEPRPSLNTTPVTLKVVSITYRIPRNYLIYLDTPSTVPTLKLTWPGLKPLTEETRKCFGSIHQSEQAGCTSFEFLLLGSRGPGPGGRALTSTERFENAIRDIARPRPEKPFGYDLYEIGPEEARTEIYRKVEGDIHFTCSIAGPEGRKRGGVCRDLFRLDDMNHLQFLFRLPHREHIPEIEKGMRELMARFQVADDARASIAPACHRTVERFIQELDTVMTETPRSTDPYNAALARYFFYRQNVPGMPRTEPGSAIIGCNREQVEELARRSKFFYELRGPPRYQDYQIEFRDRFAKVYFSVRGGTGEIFGMGAISIKPSL